MDKGPWTVGEDDDRINSDDFTHDASLILYGDFRTRDRRPYLQFIADQLNSCSTLRARIELLEGVAEAARKVDAAWNDDDTLIIDDAIGGLAAALAALEGRKG
jgi:hypothetical protein